MNLRVSLDASEGRRGRHEDRRTLRVWPRRKRARLALPDMEGWVRFARCAEEGRSSRCCCRLVVTSPTLSSWRAPSARRRRSLSLSWRIDSLMQPATFVQQINTLSGVIGGRVSLNIVAGSSMVEQRGYGDFLDHDERYARAEEFLNVCRSFWANNGYVNFARQVLPRRTRKTIHTLSSAGSNCARRSTCRATGAGAASRAGRRVSCYLRLIDTPEKLQPIVARFRNAGVEFVCGCVWCAGRRMKKRSRQRKICCRRKRSVVRVAHPFQQRLKNTQGCTRSSRTMSVDESKLRGRVWCRTTARRRLRLWDHRRISRTRLWSTNELAYRSSSSPVGPSWTMMIGREVIPLVREAEPRE